MTFRWDVTRYGYICSSWLAPNNPFLGVRGETPNMSKSTLDYPNNILYVKACLLTMCCLKIMVERGALYVCILQYEK